jgi:DNA-binding NtrC family response regulator
MASSAVGPRRTILFIDDEASILTVVEAALEPEGYRVLGAGRGAIGLELFGERHDDIDAVIMDVHIPDVTGWELLDQIRAIDETVPVLLTSGYDRNQIGAVVDDGTAGFLPKPFDFTMLRTVIEESIASVSP